MRIYTKEKKMKACKCCLIEQPVQAFYANRKTCKNCFSLAQKEYYKKNAEYIKQRVSCYGEKNKEEVSLRRKAQYATNPEKAKSRAIEWVKNNPERNRKRSAQWHIDNPGKAAARSKEWYKNNKEQAKKFREEYYEKNKALFVAHTVKRNLAKLKRTPVWLTEFDELKIKCLYQVAAMRTKESGQVWHVDHIIPLQGKLVSGLHVPNNLRVITAFENLSKHNSYEIS